MVQPPASAATLDTLLTLNLELPNVFHARQGHIATAVLLSANLVPLVPPIHYVPSSIVLIVWVA